MNEWKRRYEELVHILDNSWIPVAAHKPQIGEDVWGSDGNVSSVFRYIGEGKFLDLAAYIFPTELKYWMPMPPAPKRRALED